MIVLGISGSPKRKGFTNILLDNALEGAKSRGASTAKIIPNDLDFRPCQACGGCDSTGICVIEDDMRDVYAAVEKANAFIIASPIYFGSITAQLKAVIDRCQSLWIKKYVLKKSGPLLKKRKGIFLCTAGKDSTDYFDAAKKIIKTMFATLDIDYSGELFVGGLNTISADSHDKDVSLKRAYNLGMSLTR